MQEVKKLLLLISKEPEKGLSEATSIYGGMVYSIVASVLRGRPQDIEECVADILHKKLKAKRTTAFAI